MYDSERGPLAAPLTPPAASSVFQAADPAPAVTPGPAWAATTASAPDAARAPRRRPARATTTVLGAAFLSAILAAGGTAALVTGPLASKPSQGPAAAVAGQTVATGSNAPATTVPGPA